ncbi:4a-hydroxytetrahydrobiopterin dehydratase [Rugamonas sp. CCM 8940]|uniref:4a-hydroxytetrahydrobiopterin dehydratase n=1 Tax=Rugamonas sp. CCM 8940 TaxID=2765359 RepID=UPI0018F37DBF|nr:4a-hydroxytetrahydrobiopterin dehydratase [Rugamonas sp. CCM 8940]MBJ7308850.1 4a-hydroxytetrahydrobiopterin dehydratase [Rugamonas sp. CCM 8940]
MSQTTPTGRAIDSAEDLLQRRCGPADAALTAAEAARLLALLPGWRLEGGRLCADYGFQNYHHTMAFVNALAYLSHTEDHHPELTVTYKNCTIRYDTHSIAKHSGAGLSLNDFICAAKAAVLFHAGAAKQ